MWQYCAAERMNKMPEPLVSVIVATYRRDEVLRNALESLAKQSYQNIEIIIVDDNGNAEWNAKVRSVTDAFGRRHPDAALTLIVNDPNQGAAKARNMGIAAAGGEYVTFLDDDDLYLEDKIKHQLEFMLEGGYDYSVTDLDLFYEDGRLAEHRRRSYLNKGGDLLTNHLMHSITGNDTLMFKKTYIDAIGGFEPIDIGDDFHLMLKAIDRGGRFGYLNRSDIHAFVHTKTAGLSSGDGKIKGENEVYAFKRKYFDRLSPKARRYIRARHYAVIAYAEIRRKRYLACALNMLKAGLSSPVACIQILRQK